MHAGRVGRSTRAGGALAHLLLVVVLALGVFVMHSVGHPEGSSATGGMDHGSAPMAPMAATEHAVPAAPGDATAVMGVMPPLESAHHHEGASAETSPREARHDSPQSSGMSGMDMTTLCVAVLGGWLLAALLRAALRRGTDRTVPVLARLLASLGPNAPPPRPPDLAQLSILRI